jgi:hypothetical protein
MNPPALHTALRAHARGRYPTEAGVELIIGQGVFLPRGDFRHRFVHIATSITDGTTPMATIDWPAAVAALTTPDLPCSGGEQRILRIAASLADGIPVDLRDCLTGLDHHNIHRVIAAVLHAAGQRPSAQIS